MPRQNVSSIAARAPASARLRRPVDARPPLVVTGWMPQPSTGVLRDAGQAIDELEVALASASTQEHQRAVQAFRHALLDLAEAVSLTPDSQGGLWARNKIATACRLARSYGVKVASDSNPRPRALIDVWALAQILAELPADHLPADLRATIVNATAILSEFTTDHVSDVLRASGVPDREIGDMLSRLG